MKRARRRPRREPCYEWPSLPITEGPEPSTKASLVHLAEVLKHGRTISDHDLYWAADFLERVAANKRALEAVDRKYRHDGRVEDLALDYLVQKELAPPRQAKRAQLDVARAWGVKPPTVKWAARQWRHGTKHRLDVIAEKCAAFDPSMSRRQILERVSRDLRAWHGLDD